MEDKQLVLKLKQFDAEARTFRGHLAVFNNVDKQNDVILETAFDKSLKENTTVPLLWSHDPSKPIGRLELAKDKIGLRAKGYLTEGVAAAEEAYRLLKEGVVKGLSIGYKTIKSKVKDGVRELSELRLYEGSLVVFPANEFATVTDVKSEADLEDFKESLQRFLDAEFSET